MKYLHFAKQKYKILLRIKRNEIRKFPGLYTTLLTARAKQRLVLDYKNKTYITDNKTGKPGDWSTPRQW